MQYLRHQALALLCCKSVYEKGKSSTSKSASPIITAKDEAAVLEALRAGNMSDLNVTKVFEREFGEWFGVGVCSGSAQSIGQGPVVLRLLCSGPVCGRIRLRSFRAKSSCQESWE